MHHAQIQNYHCPKCGGNLEPGYITGQWSRLRWCLKEKTKTVFSGKPLKKVRDIWNAPTIAAARCDKCKLGLFSYDN